jgi:hypothetical protein
MAAALMDKLPLYPDFHSGVSEDTNCLGCDNFYWVIKYSTLALLPSACFSCSPPDLNFLDPYIIFMYMHYNHCHRVTAHLQLNIQGIS